MKKIFCIFSVVLILIMATVPCFASTVNFSTNLFLRFNNTVGRADYLVYDSDLLYYDIGEISLLGDHRYLFQYQYISGQYIGPTNVSLFLYFYYNSGYEGFSVSSVYSDQSFIFSPAADIVSRRVTIRPFEDLVFNFRIFDITDLDFITSSSEGDSYFSWFENSFPSYQLNNTVSNPFISFVGSLVHIFDFVPQIFSQSGYLYQPFLLITGSLFICLMIFIVVLVIRRCRS